MDRRSGHAGARRPHHLLVPVEQVHLLAVDRHRQPLAQDLTERVVRLAHVAFEDRNDLELVVTVGRKLVLDQDAAARAERQPLDVVVLRGVVGYVELDERGRGIRRHRQAADLARRRQIRLHQRRRHRQRAGNVVEPAGRIIGGQEFRGVDLHPEEIANDVLILGPIETVNPGRRQVGDRVAVQLVFHPRDEPVERRLVGPRRAKRRHHPGAQLHGDLLGHVRMVGQAREVELVQRQTAGLQPRVVTPDAVLVEHRPLGGRVHRRRGACLSAVARARHARWTAEGPGRTRPRPPGLPESRRGGPVETCNCSVRKDCFSSSFVVIMGSVYRSVNLRIRVCGRGRRSLDRLSDQSSLSRSQMSDVCTSWPVPSFVTGGFKTSLLPENSRNR